MLRWIACIKSMNPEFIHISGKDNAVADMLSRARYDEEEAMISDEEDVGSNFYFMALARREGNCFAIPLELGGFV